MIFIILYVFKADLYFCLSSFYLSINLAGHMCWWMKKKLGTNLLNRFVCWLIMNVINIYMRNKNFLWTKLSKSLIVFHCISHIQILIHWSRHLYKKTTISWLQEWLTNKNYISETKNHWQHCLLTDHSIKTLNPIIASYFFHVFFLVCVFLKSGC